MKSKQEVKRPGDDSIVYVGVDVAKDTLAVFADGLFEGEIPNTGKGLAALVKTLRRKAGKEREIRFALEETGAYSLPVRLTLDKLHEKACVLDPAHVRYYARAKGVMAKTDRIDARVIRLYAAECRIEPTPLPSQARLALRDILRTRSLLAKVKGMLQVALQITPLPTCRLVLKEIVSYIDERIKRLERDMLETARQDPAIERVAHALCAKLPGVGTLTATTVATLLPELGSMGRRRAAAIAGLAPVARESGLFKGQRRIGGGRADLRRALYMPALVAIRHDPVQKAFYERLIKKGKKPKVAIAACMRKMLVHMDRVIANLDKPKPAPAP